MDSRGFTLSELLLAAAIAVFAFAGILALYVSCLFLNDANRNLTIALTHAQYAMEDIRNTNFLSLKTKIDNGDWDWNSAGIASRGLSPLTNEAIDTQATGTDPLDVRVTVIWQDRTGRNRQAYLETLFTTL